MKISVNRIIEYFDLASKIRPRQDQQAKGEGEGITIHWLPQYVALVLGILVQPFFQQYMTAKAVDLSQIGGWLVASLVIAIMAFPGVYRNSFDARQPIFVQFCVIFTSGTGWQSLASAAFHAAGIATP